MTLTCTIVFAQEDNKILSIDDISVSATPTTSETASLVDKGLRKSRDKDLREEVRKHTVHWMLFNNLELVGT